MASVTLGEGSTLQGRKYHIVKVLGQGGTKDLLLVPTMCFAVAVQPHIFIYYIRY